MGAHFSSVAVQVCHSSGRKGHLQILAVKEELAVSNYFAKHYALNKHSSQGEQQGEEFCTMACLWHKMQMEGKK